MQNFIFPTISFIMVLVISAMLCHLAGTKINIIAPVYRRLGWLAASLHIVAAIIGVCVFDAIFSYLLRVQGFLGHEIGTIGIVVAMVYVGIAVGTFSCLIFWGQRCGMYSNVDKK